MGEPLARAFLAAAIGLLIGIERGWQEREFKDGSRVAGIRTFTLIGALGGICGLLPGGGTVFLGLCFLAFALPFGFFEWQKAKETHSVSATDLITGLLTFALGGYAARGDMVVAGACGVAAAVILAERNVLHTFLRRLKWIELRAALLLLVMTAVLLPVLPDRTVDPWNTLNPHQIWLMTILVGAVSYSGYVAVRVAGARNGLFFAGLMGGIATSTTVTWMFARLARKDATALPAIMSAILAAWIVSLLRMTGLAIAIAPGLLAFLAPPILASVAVLVIPAAGAFRAAARAQAQPLTLEDPFDPMLMLRFLALLSVIMLMAKLFSGTNSGLFALGGASGLLDVDPITLSMARLSGNGVTQTMAVATILVAAASNGMAKSVLAMAFGGWKLGTILGACALASLAAGYGAFILLG